MPSGPLRQIRPAWTTVSAYCPRDPGLEEGPRKSIEFLVTNVQSPSRMKGLSSQSFLPASFLQMTWEDSPCPLSCASLASAGLRHSSSRNFNSPSCVVEGDDRQQ